MEPITPVPSKINQVTKPKWLMQLSIAALVVSVAAIASGITFALVSNGNNKVAKNPVNDQTITTTVIESTPKVTAVIPTTTPIPNKKSTEIVSLDAKSNQYINYDLGIAVTYPKEGQGYPSLINPSNCTIDPNSFTLQSKSGPLNLFDNTIHNFIFISYDKYINYQYQHTKSNGEINAKCSLENTTTDVLYNGYNQYALYPKGAPTNTTGYPDQERIIVGKIDSDQDFVDLLNNNLQYPTIEKDCKFLSKTLVAGSTDQYDVKMGSTTGEGFSSCPGAIDAFRYSSKYRSSYLLFHHQSMPLYTFTTKFLP